MHRPRNPAARDSATLYPPTGNSEEPNPSLPVTHSRLPLPHSRPFASISGQKSSGKFNHRLHRFPQIKPPGQSAQKTDSMEQPQPAMKSKSTDPIMAEAHAVKDAISAEFNYDIDALCRHMRAVGKSIAANQTQPAPQAANPSQAKTPKHRAKRLCKLRG